MSSEKSNAPSDAGGGVLKFIIGVAVGTALAFGYVRWGISKPGILELPDKLRGNIVSTAAEYDLYDLSKPASVRLRALEVLFQNRPQFAAQVDAEFKHPFLMALYRKRVIREARQLRMQWNAFDVALDKPALRRSLAEKHGTNDIEALKRAMLMRQFRRKEFLTSWVTRNLEPVTNETLLATLRKLSAQP